MEPAIEHERNRCFVLASIAMRGILDLLTNELGPDTPQAIAHIAAHLLININNGAEPGEVVNGEKTT